MSPVSVQAFSYSIMSEDARIPEVFIGPGDSGLSLCVNCYIIMETTSRC